MRRLHLFEIAEQPWCPRAIRHGVTDYLCWAVEVGDVYAGAAPVLADVLRATGVRVVVDLGAGGGGPWRRLHADLRSMGLEVGVRLTDASPNLAAFARAELASDGGVRGDARRIDARDVPPDLRGVRTLFSVFHHFTPRDARAILADAARQGAPIAVFEATRRDLRALLVTLLVPLLVLIGTPMIRPFRWSRLFWTYLVPVIPLVACWDGLVSCLRTYTVEELRVLVTNIDTMAEWSWRADEITTKGPIPVTMLVGYARVSR
jgi:SAM-dependent methyltransferase